MFVGMTMASIAFSYKDDIHVWRYDMSSIFEHILENSWVGWDGIYLLGNISLIQTYYPYLNSLWNNVGEIEIARDPVDGQGPRGSDDARRDEGRAVLTVHLHFKNLSLQQIKFIWRMKRVW